MKLHREILRLAIPSILANITVPLVGMVDIAIAGHLSSGFGSAALIGGISVGTMLFDLLYWNFAFLRAGTGGLTAQAFGAGEATGSILLRALRIALLSGLALIALQWVVVWLAFKVVDCTPEVQQLASQYFYIRIWAAPATLSLFAFKGWFIGMQDSVRAMTADLVVNGVNILGSLVLALGIPGLFSGLGFRGIALGTVLAQWTGAAYCTLAILARYRSQFARSVPKNGHFQGQSGQNSASVRKNGHFQGRSSFFTLNRDLFLRSLGMIAVYIGFTAISAGFGDMMLAVSTILMKLLMIFSYFTDGFAYAGEALTGRFVGERSSDGIKSTVSQTFIWCIGVAALFMLVYGLGGVPLFRLMTSDPSVVDAGRAFLPWLLLMPAIGCPAFVWDGIFIGATASKHLRNSTLLCAIGFFAFWLAGRLLAPGAKPETLLHILMGAYFIHLAVRSVYLTAAWPRLLPKILPTHNG
jgi:MATE family multidrug resistance protein